MGRSGESVQAALLLLPPFLLILTSIQAQSQTSNFCASRRRLYPRRVLELTLGGFLPRVGWDAWRDGEITTLTQGQEAQSLAASLRPAIRMAQKDIQGHPCLLEGYKLRVTFKDTECQASEGMRSFFELMNSTSRPLAVFGDACTKVNEPLGMTAKYWDVLQLSYAETHPQFASTDTFPTFYRMVPSSREQQRARVAFLQHFNWTRLATLKQSDSPQHALPHEAFTTLLPREHGIRVLDTAEFSTEKPNVTSELAVLKQKDARILVGDFSVLFAKEIFCQAYRLGFTGSDYVWIIPGFHSNEWWLEEDDMGECSEEELFTAMEGHFITEHVTSRQWSDNRTGLNGKTVGEYLSEYALACVSDGECEGANAVHAYAYDGLFALAVALDTVLRSFPSTSGERLEPKNAVADRKWLLDALHAALNTTAFLGVTGMVKFEDRDRLGKIRIAQFQNGSYVTVGEYDGAMESFRLDSRALGAWSPPRDGTQHIYRRERVPWAMLVAMSGLAVAGIALALAFLILNIHFRNHRYIRMSSPNMNNLIIAGSLLCYGSVLLLGLDSAAVGEDAFPALCYSKVWVLSLGFTLAFGSMFSKTWRVHSIFTNIKLNKKAIKDYKLFLLVGVLVIVDAAVLSTWALLAPTTLRLDNLPEIRKKSQALVIVPQIERCYSENSLIFQSILYGFKGLLLLLGCFLAWETRRVKVPALNDSKYIGMSVYGVVVACLLGVSLSFVLADRNNESFVLSSLFILFSTTLTLALVFGPKAIEIIKNPKGMQEKKYRHGLLGGGDTMKLSVGGSADSGGGGGVAEEDGACASTLQADIAAARVILSSRVQELENLERTNREESPDTQLQPKGTQVDSGVVEASVSSVVPEDPALQPVPPVPRSPHLQDVDEETSLLPSPEEPEARRRGGGSGSGGGGGSGGPAFMSRIRASLKRSCAVAAEPEDPKLRRDKGGDSGGVLANPSTGESGVELEYSSAGGIPPSYYSMPELRPSFPWTQRQALLPKDAGNPGPQSHHPPVPIAPFQPKGDRLRYIDAGTGEETDAVLNHSRTLTSIDETQDHGMRGDDVKESKRFIPASGEYTEKRRRGKGKSGRSAQQRHLLWPWLDPSLPVSQV